MRVSNSGEEETVLIGHADERLCPHCRGTCVEDLDDPYEEPCRLCDGEGMI